MNKSFEKILYRLEREIAGKPTPEEYNNGINRAYTRKSEENKTDSTEGNSWIDLLGKLIEFTVPNESKKTLIDLVSNFSKHCSLLEIYDFINSEQLFVD